MLKRGTWIAVAAFFFVASACGSTRPADCPVTVPNGSTPPGEAPSDRFYGNGQLWTVLWPEGTVNIATEDMDDAIRDGLKWPWWRGEGAEGELTIEGSELHGRPGSVSAIVLPGYGLTGFQVTGVIIPSDGCWEVIGRSGDAELRFITRLVITE